MTTDRAQMKLSFLEFNKCEVKPILFLYHAGSGGEFIAKTFANNHPQYKDLKYTIDTENNQCHSISPIMYSSQWPDRNNPETWMNPHYIDDGNRNLGYVVKDHPTSFNIELYNEHVKYLVTIHLQAKTEQRWFARLLFAKLRKKIEAPVTTHFIRTHVNDLITPERELQIIRWSSQFNWVWANEVMICNSRLAENLTLDDFNHHDSLDKYIDDHIEQDKQYQGGFSNQLRKNYETVNIDSLVTDSTKFWNKLKAMYHQLNVEPCINQTDEWILNNHRLLIKNDY